VKLYRVMKVDLADGKPMVGTSGSRLGVRPTDPASTNPRAVFDVAAVNDGDVVQPGEGLSTSPNPTKRLPRRGEAVFEIESDALGPTITAHQDSPDHCLLEPIQPMTLAEFQQALADTRGLWQRL
jgi:hypothetical protein